MLRYDYTITVNSIDSEDEIEEHFSNEELVAYLDGCESDPDITSIVIVRSFH